ncbi:MAG: hypothetical protein A3K12_04050 [Candidatus Rokubacteria bacterium RIFCSPLOWO2_12_FULL_71_19]|nr:MAG: hypothetical protein A3K12_04050 [Candidatus Rokubacteria bacterium RIFCSPLOWO2_12_FULL_71_19]
MSPRLLLVNAALLAVAGLFAFQLQRELSRARPLPPPPAPRAAPTAAAPASAPSLTGGPRPDLRPLYGVIATKNLFSPSRTEVVTNGGTPGAPVMAKPLLHGVVVADGKSRAYLEDPASKKVFGYAVGDQVSGGRLEAIRDDRVVIARPEGPIEVLLRDPAKPRPAPPAAAPTPAAARRAQQLPSPPPAPAAPGAAIAPTPGRPAGPSLVPPRPEVGQALPRALQSLPPDFLRRRVPASPGPAAGQSGG